MAGRPEGDDEAAPGDGNARNHRIEQLRQQIDDLKARITAAQAEQRRAVMELNELLQEKRHIAARARRWRRAARWRPPPDDEEAAGGSDPPSSHEGRKASADPPDDEVAP